MVLHEDRMAGFGLRQKAVEEDVQDPVASARVGLDSRGVEDLGGEIAAKESPRGAEKGSVDVVLVSGDDLVDEEGGWAVGEDGAVLDEGLVGQGVVGDKDSGAGADAEGDDGSVLGVEFAENRLHLRGLVEEK